MLVHIQQLERHSNRDCEDRTIDLHDHHNQQLLGSRRLPNRRK
jgi:hypothetical protein